MIRTPAPAPDPYALSPAVYAAVVGALISLLLKPVFRWANQRAAHAKYGASVWYARRRTTRSLPVLIRLRAGPVTRADVLAEWQRLITRREREWLTVIVCIVLGQVGSRATQGVGVLISLSSIVSLAATWRQVGDYEWAYMCDQDRALSEVVDEAMSDPLRRAKRGELEAAVVAARSLPANGGYGGRVRGTAGPPPDRE